MNGWDAMLAWLSQRPEVNWETAKGASRRLSAVYGRPADDSPLLHAWHWIDPLLTLGDIEFDHTANTLIASPPGLLWCSHFRRCVLYGAWFEDRLSSLKHEFELQETQPSGNADGPTRRILEGVTADNVMRLRAVADDLKVWFGDDTTLRVQKALPNVAEMLANLEEDTSLPEGTWTRYDSDAEGNHWLTVDPPLRTAGVYRRPSGAPPYVWIRSDGSRSRLLTPDHRRAAQWLSHNGTVDPWIYIRSKSALWIPWHSPPLPMLVSRGLTTATGVLPSRVEVEGSQWKEFQYVTEEGAAQSARIMDRQLNIVDRTPRPTSPLQSAMSRRLRRLTPDR